MAGTATVKVIPARDMAPEILRVAAYCRVSSDSTDQLHSYATQIRSYTDYIESHNNWELVDIYADEGLTGTRMDKRDDFNRMMADCRKGKIDMILVKSISRFARNTKDCLVALRELSSLSVTVRFEEDNIDTKTLTSEMMVSVFGSLAQQESVSISQNQRMSYKRRMEKGEFITCCSPYGYRIQDGKHLVIYEEEAKWVRWIFDHYLTGYSLFWIAKSLDNLGVPTPANSKTWRRTTVGYILTNEKYIGNSLSQKKYSTETLPFVRKYNKGQEDQYYAAETHPAIISADDFYKVQTLMAYKGVRDVKKETHFFSQRIICGECGSTFTRRATKNGYVTWVCNNHDEKASNCPVGRIPEQRFRDAFVHMFNKLQQNYDIILEPAIRQLNALNEAMHRSNPKMAELNRAIADVADQNHKIQKLLSSGVISADICTAKTSALDAKMKQLQKERKNILREDISLEILEGLKELEQVLWLHNDGLQAFDEELYDTIIEKIVVYEGGGICFRLRCSIELYEKEEE